MNNLELAEGALTENDDRLALHYLAQVLATAPNDERALALLAGISSRTDVLKVIPARGFVGHTVLRAWALQRRGSPEAIRLLARAAIAVPNRGLELVLASWLVARHAAGQELPDAERQLCYRYLASVLDSTIGLHRLWPGEHRLLEGAIDCAAALADFSHDELGLTLLSALLRRAGRVEEALALTAPGAARGEVLALRANALALRTAGRGAEAALGFAQVHGLEPDPAELVEQARSWYVAGKPEAGLEALRRVPLPWSEEVVALERLLLHPPSVDPLADLDRLVRQHRQHGYLAPRRDASARARPHSRAESQLGLADEPAWEPPSARLVRALTSGSAAVADPSYAALLAELPFDPLQGKRELTLWTMGSAGLQQAVPPPPKEVREAVARVATTTGDGLELLDAAALVARSFDAGQAPTFAHAMVHPPVGQRAAPDALYRTQCAAAALIAHLPGPIAGPRGDTLRALAQGQADWPAAAAIFALAHLARHDAEAAPFARDALIEVVPLLVPHEGEPRAEQLSVALGSIPGVPPDSQSALAAWSRAIVGRAPPE